MTTTTLEELTRVVAAMPADAAKQVLDFARFLDQQRNRQIEHADWDDDARRQARLRSFLRFQEEHGEEDWGIDYSALTEGKTGPPPAT
jgi:hypothetical protein